MLILASSSKSRSIVLCQNGLEHVLLPPDIDEKAVGVRTMGDASSVCLAVANAKMDAILPRVRHEETYKDAVIITADQVVSYKDAIREKPVSKEVCISRFSLELIHRNVEPF